MEMTEVVSGPTPGPPHKRAPKGYRVRQWADGFYHAYRGGECLLETLSRREALQTAWDDFEARRLAAPIAAEPSGPQSATEDSLSQPVTAEAIQVAAEREVARLRAAGWTPRDFSQALKELLGVPEPETGESPPAPAQGQAD